MVIKQFYNIRDDGVLLYKSFSDRGVKIQKVVVTWNGKRIPKNEFYDEAIDVENAPYEYVETEQEVENTEKQEQSEVK